MRTGHTTLVNPATSSKAELPSDDARSLARTLGQQVAELEDAIHAGKGSKVAPLSVKIAETRAHLHRIVASPASTPATVKCALRALGLDADEADRAVAAAG